MPTTHNDYNMNNNMNMCRSLLLTTIMVHDGDNDYVGNQVATMIISGKYTMIINHVRAN